MSEQRVKNRKFVEEESVGLETVEIAGKAEIRNSSEEMKCVKSVRGGALRVWLRVHWALFIP